MIGLWRKLVAQLSFDELMAIKPAGCKRIKGSKVDDWKQNAGMQNAGYLKADDEEPLEMASPGPEV